MRRLGLTALALLAAGCTVGSGSGSAVGKLFDTGCNKNDTLAMPQTYSLSPSFFAGEPIEDVCPPPGKCSGPRMNRLVMRMQQSGNRVEVNDTLYFDVETAYEVARCLRGRIKGGLPDWDTRLVTAADGTPVAGLPWCDWTTPETDGGTAPDPDAGASDAGVADAGGTDGGAPLVATRTRARINLSPQDFVQASLVPLYTCVEARSVAVALAGSWIDFEDFGLALQTATAAESRDAVVGDFKVDFGQRLHASFHLVLGDEAVEHAIKTRASVPTARIGGALDGRFDFDLERGRAAQPFP